MNAKLRIRPSLNKNRKRTIKGVTQASNSRIGSNLSIPNRWATLTFQSSSLKSYLMDLIVNYIKNSAPRTPRVYPAFLLTRQAHISRTRYAQRVSEQGKKHKHFLSLPFFYFYYNSIHGVHKKFIAFTINTTGTQRTLHQTFLHFFVIKNQALLIYCQKQPTCPFAEHPPILYPFIFLS